MHLVVDVKACKWLADYQVSKPEEEVVRVTTNLVFEVTLHNDNRYTHHHKRECYSIDYAENSYNYVLVKDSREGERAKHAHT